jgi:polysaccharide export outer membrane protein
MRNILYFVAFAVLLSSCKIYNQNVIFKTETELNIPEVEALRAIAERNYIIKPDDFISVRLFSVEGEALVEPILPANLMGQQGGMVGGGGMMMGAQQGGLQQRYLIQTDGSADLPMIGNISLKGYTLHQADSVLTEAYSQFYKDLYVRTQYLNKRVIVFRGAGATVVPLENENMHLIEVLAIAGGFDNSVRATNIRIIRGDLKDPTVFIVNLKTIEDMRKAYLRIEPNDIIYVEPIRKSILEGLSDLSGLLGLLATIFSFAVLIRSTNN